MCESCERGDHENCIGEPTTLDGGYLNCCCNAADCPNCLQTHCETDDCHRFDCQCRECLLVREIDAAAVSIECGEVEAIALKRNRGGCVFLFGLKAEVSNEVLMKLSELRELSDRVTSALTPDLIKPKYRREDCKVAGACYIVSEALYHLGAKDLGYKPKRVKLDGITHWWLEKDTGEIWDLTCGQFPTERLFEYYDAGVFGGFLTREPSARALQLMRRVAAQTHYTNCRGRHKVKLEVKL